MYGLICRVENNMKKRCPFCGSDIVHLLIDEDRVSAPYAYICARCGTTGPHRETPEQALGIWNDRRDDHGTVA